MISVTHNIIIFLGKIPPNTIFSPYTIFNVMNVKDLWTKKCIVMQYWERLSTTLDTGICIFKTVFLLLQIDSASKIFEK